MGTAGQAVPAHAPEASACGVPSDDELGPGRKRSCLQVDARGAAAGE
jgi:hypothetical protein